MAVVIVSDEMPAKTKTIRFIRNTCEAGVDYGPDYAEDTVEVAAHRADYYIGTGRAVEVEAKPAAAPDAAAPTESPDAAPARPEKRQRG